MDKLTYIRSIVLNSVIFVCTSIGTIAGIISVTKCLSKEDYHGAIKNFFLSILGIALIIGYPMVVSAIKGMINA